MRLTDFIIWDNELTPTYAPQIVLPGDYLSLNDDEKWIQVGKWRVKIIIREGPNGIPMVSKNGANIVAESAHGSQFFDLTAVEVELVKDAKAFGSASGCFKFEW